MRDCDLFITPEFALTGYPPGDLILRNDFLKNVEIYKNKIVEITINKKTIFSLSIPL